MNTAMPTTLPEASSLVTLGIPALAALVVALFLLAVRRAAPERLPVVAAITAAWLLVTGWPPRAGCLAPFNARPPPWGLVRVGAIRRAGAVSATRLGPALAEKTPLFALVAFHAFRLPLELIMHRAAGEHVMPSVMSYSGRNFDILTGATALVVAAILWRRPSRALALLWNALGLALLVNVVAVAVAATPIFGAFGPEQSNTWIAHFPFVYLPAVLVAAALAGHLVIFRKLRR